MSAVPKSFILDHLAHRSMPATSALPLPIIEAHIGVGGEVIYSSPALPGETSRTWEGLFWLMEFLEVLYDHNE